MTNLLRLAFSGPRQDDELLLMRGSDAVEDCQYVVFAHDQVVLAIELDFLARIFAKQDVIARLHVERDALAVVLHLAATSGDHLASLRLLSRPVLDTDPSAFLLAFFDAPDHDSIVQGSDVHECNSKV